MLILAIILGGLMIYFLTPSQRKASEDFRQAANKTFFVALKNSLIMTTLHRKAIFAVLLFLLSLIAIWWSHLQMEQYNIDHGIITQIKPTEQAISYIISSAFYAVIIYVSLVFVRTLKLLRSGK